MNAQATRARLGTEIPGAVVRPDDASSLLVDSAIGRCENLRRVLELEEWINGAAGNPLLAASCRNWQAERGQLLADLNLEMDAANAETNPTAEPVRGPLPWFRKILNRLRNSELPHSSSS